MLNISPRTSTDITLLFTAFCWGTGATEFYEIMKSHIDNRNPKLMASTGSVLYDQPHIHVDVTADFYMFTPVRKDDLFEKRILIVHVANISTRRPRAASCAAL